LLGGIPGIPKVRLHNRFLAFENGEDFLLAFHLAAEGNLTPFILVIEGSIPNEHNKKEGYWASVGTDQKTGQPITTCEWIDRLAPTNSPGIGVLPESRDRISRVGNDRIVKGLHPGHPDEEDLVDQLFNPSEKRLARMLLLLAHFGKEGVPETVITKISQETLAEMVGTTRSRVSFFMKRFRKLGVVDYGESGGCRCIVRCSMLSFTISCRRGSSIDSS
jgi:hypothetical protein